MDKSLRQIKREKFRDVLRAICPNVYFQKPGNSKMTYPVILYEYNRINALYADNRKYFQTIEFLVTVIDRDPDSTIVDQINELPYCRYDNDFKKDNLYHTTFVAKI